MQQTDSRTPEQVAHDRRSRAWVFLVLGLLAAWITLGMGTSDGAWQIPGWILFCGAVAAVIRGLVLFQKPRP